MHKPGRGTEDMIMEQLLCQPMWLLIRLGKENLGAWKLHLGYQHEESVLLQSLHCAFTSSGIEAPDSPD